jgi:hypothetical protein
MPINLETELLGLDLPDLDHAQSKRATSMKNKAYVAFPPLLIDRES